MGSEMCIRDSHSYTVMVKLEDGFVEFSFSPRGDEDITLYKVWDYKAI